jgi:hypothetical protein
MQNQKHRLAILAVAIVFLAVGSVWADQVKDVRHDAYVVSAVQNNTSEGPSLWEQGGLFGDWAPSQELVRYRSENSKTFDNLDGTYSTLIAGPIHRQDRSGNWVDLPEMQIVVDFDSPEEPPKGETDDQVQVGTGTSTHPTMWYIYYNYFRAQQLYYASELGGLNAGGMITAIAFYGNQANTDVMNGTEQWCKDTTSTSVIAAWENPGTRVYNANFTVNATGAGWNTMTFQTQFSHAAGQNLLISNRHQDGSYEASYISYRYSTHGSYRRKRAYNDYSNPPPTFFRYTGYSNILITYTLTSLANDVACTAVRMPAGNSVPTDTTFYPQVKIINYGTTAQSSIPVRVTIDSAGSTIYNATATVTGPLSQGDTALVTMTTAFTTASSAGYGYDLEAYTYHTGDQDRSNDTAYVAFMTTASYNPYMQFVWKMDVDHVAAVGVTSVQDTLIWVSSGGLTGSPDANFILRFDARTRTFIDSFPQAVTTLWGFRDMSYDPVTDRVYAGTDGNQLYVYNATTLAVESSYTVTGAQVPGTVRALAFDGDSLYSGNFSSSPVVRFAVDGSNSHRVMPSAPPYACYGLGYDASGGRFYMSEATTGAVVAQYDAATWTVLGDTAPIPGGMHGGCELWKNDTFLLLFEQGTPDAVWCFRLIQLANDVGVTASGSYPYTAVVGETHDITRHHHHNRQLRREPPDLDTGLLRRRCDPGR